MSFLHNPLHSVASVPPQATAYPHRDKTMLVTCERAIPSSESFLIPPSQAKNFADVNFVAALEESCFKLGYEFVKIILKYNPDPDQV